MEPSTQIDLQAPSSRGPRRIQGMRHAIDARGRRAAKRAVLWLHGQADRFDLIPSEFGREEPVDAGSARSVIREWRRQARLWAAYNPEEMFALKAGAVALGIAFVVLLAIVGAMG